MAKKGTSYTHETYNLETIKRLIRSSSRKITTLARLNAYNLRYSVGEVYEIVSRLEKTHFHKTMEAEKLPGSGLFQDVYRFPDRGLDLYVKVQIIDEGGEREAKVIDFKEWGKE